MRHKLRAQDAAMLALYDCRIIAARKDNAIYLMLHRSGLAMIESNAGLYWTWRPTILGDKLGKALSHERTTRLGRLAYPADARFQSEQRDRNDLLVP